MGTGMEQIPLQDPTSCLSFYKEGNCSKPFKKVKPCSCEFHTPIVCSDWNLPSYRNLLSALNPKSLPLRPTKIPNIPSPHKSPLTPVCLPPLPTNFPNFTSSAEDSALSKRPQTQTIPPKITFSVLKSAHLSALHSPRGWWRVCPSAHLVLHGNFWEKCLEKKDSGVTWEELLEGREIIEVSHLYLAELKKKEKKTPNNQNIKYLAAAIRRQNLSLHIFFKFTEQSSRKNKSEDDFLVSYWYLLPVGQEFLFSTIIHRELNFNLYLLPHWPWV